MKFSYINIWLLIAFLCFITIGCQSEHNFTESSVYQKYFDLTEEQWITVLNKIGFDKDNLSDTVLLVTSSTHCPDCLNELSFWNDLDKEVSNSFNLYLVVIERYENRFRNFLERNNLEIQSYQDKTALLPQNDLIPFVPIKIYFGNNGNKKRFHSIGSDHSLNDFLAEFTSVQIES